LIEKGSVFVLLFAIRLKGIERRERSDWYVKGCEAGVSKPQRRVAVTGC
jgi:hypothetical protein